MWIIIVKEEIKKHTEGNEQKILAKSSKQVDMKDWIFIYTLTDRMGCACAIPIR